MFKQELDQSVVYFQNLLSASIIDSSSHDTVMITGLDRNAKTIRQLSIYVVGVMNNAIEANLRINAKLMKEIDMDRLKMVKGYMLSLLNDHNDYILDRDKMFIDRKRNPWLAEVIVHLLLNISVKVLDIHPTGQVLTVSFVHDLPTDNGLDAAALYTSTSLGLTVVECKAYKNRPSDALRDATNYYKDFEINYVLDKRIRTHVQTMKAYLREEHEVETRKTFWNDEKTFLPTIFYDASHVQNWHVFNEKMNQLSVKKEKRILIPIQIQDFHEFFNDLSDGIRSYTKELLQRV